MDCTNQIKDNEIIVFANTSLYSKDSIFKCIYWYGSKFHSKVDIVQDNGAEYFKIILTPLEGEFLSSEQQKEILSKLENDLIDFNLRDIVTKETKNIRDLLTAKAFSNGEFDELPPGEVSDPIGFKIDEE